MLSKARSNTAVVQQEVAHAYVPGGLVGGPRAYQDQFRGFTSHRVHMLAGTFSCMKKLTININSGKRESVS